MAELRLVDGVDRGLQQPRHAPASPLAVRACTGVHGIGRSVVSKSQHRSSRAKRTSVLRQQQGGQQLLERLAVLGDGRIRSVQLQGRQLQQPGALVQRRCTLVALYSSFWP